jgi:hypothetical protein
LGDKSKTGTQVGMNKVRQIAEHVNLILSYIPYVQTNSVLGLDADEGAEPFELTKRFLDLTPGAISRVFAAHGVWPRRTAQPRLPACKPRFALSLPFLEQRSGHERQAQKLFLA